MKTPNNYAYSPGGFVDVQDVFISKKGKTSSDAGRSCVAPFRIQDVSISPNSRSWNKVPFTSFLYTYQWAFKTPFKKERQKVNKEENTDTMRLEIEQPFEKLVCFF